MALESYISDPEVASVLVISQERTNARVATCDTANSKILLFMYVHIGAMHKVIPIYQVLTLPIDIDSGVGTSTV